MDPIYEAYTLLVESQQDMFADDGYSQVKHQLAQIPAEDESKRGMLSKIRDRFLDDSGHEAVHSMDRRSFYKALGKGAHDPKGASKEIFDIAKNHPNHLIRAASAESPLASHEDLMKFSTDPHPAVRAAVTDRKELPLETLKAMRHDPDHRVHSAAVDAHRWRMHPDWDGEHDYGGYFDHEEEHELKGTLAGSRIEATAC